VIYEELDLRVVADGEVFTVLARCADTHVSHPLLLPGELAAHVPCSGGAMPGLPQPLRDIAVQATSGRAEIDRSLRRIGGLLFEALLGGPVRSLFDRSLGAAVREGRGLVTRLHLDPRDVRLRGLQELPWELLWSEDTGFLGFNPQTPVVRCLDSPRPVHALPLSSPLRVLAVMANPSSTLPLDLAAERRRIEQAARKPGGVRASFLEHATRETLRLRLREESFHIVHFMGHGRFAGAIGALLLESPAGAADPADPLAAEDFAALFSGREQPILVVLNACHTARSSGAADVDPFTGVASALILAGLPGVLAMRTGISDPAAIEVTAELYRCLSRGEPLAAIVSEVRLALHNTCGGSADWAIPALFLRHEPPIQTASVAPDPRPADPVGAAPHPDFEVINHERVGKQVFVKAKKAHIDVH
jgi:hypothetical protein